MASPAPAFHRGVVCPAELSAWWLVLPAIPLLFQTGKLAVVIRAFLPPGAEGSRFLHQRFAPAEPVFASA